MTDLDKVNAWAARECEIVQGASLWFIGDEVGGEGKWSVEKAECMQVIREHFNIETIRYPRKSCHWQAVLPNGKCSTGNTIPEAEQACVIAIYKSMEEKKQ